MEAIYRRMVGRLIHMEQLVEWELEGETEILAEIPIQYTSSTSKSHMTWTGTKPSPPRWETGGWCLSYGTAHD
jgi:hypothetical protein